MRQLIGFAAVLSTLGLAGAADAADVTSVSQLHGWINSAGGQVLPTPDHNMFTGNEFGMRFNSYAIFYIPTGTYSSATLSVSPTPFGNVPPSVIGLYDVSTDLETLVNDYHPGTDAFADLGSGSLYAQQSMYDSPLSFALGGNFIADANAAAGSYLVIGFTNLTLNATPSGDDQDDGIYISGVGRGFTPLTLTLSTGPAGVPEPATWAMLIAGFGMAGGAMRVRRRTVVMN